MKTQYGRTLIEILGALALIGALTFIGVKSYKILYAKHQANEAFESVQCQMLELDLLDLDRIDLDEDITSGACENDSGVEIKVVRTEMEDEDGGEISNGYYVELTDLTPEACRQVLSKPWETEFEIAVGCEGRTFNPDEPDYSVCDIFDEDYEPECLEEYIEEDIGEVSLLDNALPSDSIFHKILGISNAYAGYDGTTVVYKNGKWIRIYRQVHTFVDASCPEELMTADRTCCPKRTAPYFNGLFSGCCYIGSVGTYAGTLTVYNGLFRIRSDIMVKKGIKEEGGDRFVELPLQDCCVEPAIRDIYDANGKFSGTRYCCESYETEGMSPECKEWFDRSDTAKLWGPPPPKGCNVKNLEYSGGKSSWDADSDELYDKYKKYAEDYTKKNPPFPESEELTNYFYLFFSKDVIQKKEPQPPALVYDKKTYEKLYAEYESKKNERSKYERFVKAFGDPDLRYLDSKKAALPLWKGKISREKLIRRYEAWWDQALTDYGIPPENRTINIGGKLYPTTMSLIHDPDEDITFSYEQKEHHSLPDNPIIITEKNKEAESVFSGTNGFSDSDSPHHLFIVSNSWWDIITAWRVCEELDNASDDSNNNPKEALKFNRRCFDSTKEALKFNAVALYLHEIGHGVDKLASKRKEGHKLGLDNAMRTILTEIRSRLIEYQKLYQIVSANDKMRECVYDYDPAVIDAFFDKLFPPPEQWMTDLGLFQNIDGSPYDPLKSERESMKQFLQEIKNNCKGVHDKVQDFFGQIENEGFMPFDIFYDIAQSKGIERAMIEAGITILDSDLLSSDNSYGGRAIPKDKEGNELGIYIATNIDWDSYIRQLPNDEVMSHDGMREILERSTTFWDWVCSTYSYLNPIQCMERQMANRAVKDGLCCDPESEKLYCAKWKKEDINNDGKNDKLHCEDGFAMCCPVDSVVAINKDGNGNLTAECCPVENVYPTREIYKENEWDDQEEGIPLSVCCKDDSYFDEYSKTCCPEGYISDGMGNCCNPNDDYRSSGCLCTEDYLKYKCEKDEKYCGWKEGLKDGSLVVRGGIVRYSDDYGRKGTCVEGRCVGGEEWCELPGGCCPCWGLTYENNRPVYDGECSYCPAGSISGYTSEELKAAVERGEVKVKSIPPNFLGGTCLECANYNGVWYPGSEDENSVAYTRDSSCLLCPPGTSPEGKGEPYYGVEECRCQYKGQEYIDAGYFDTEENKGCFCPPGTYLNKSKEECSPCGNSDGSDSNEYREEWNNEDSCSICSGQEALAIRIGHTNSVLSEGNDSCVTCYHQYGPEEPYWNGNECVPCYEDISSGGEVWSDESREDGSCTSCSAKNYLYPRWNDVSKQCEECPPETPLWNGYNSCEPCPPEMPVWNGSYCEPCPPDTPAWNGYSCEPCPAETPAWDGYSCQPCPNETPMWDGYSCQPCPNETPMWNGYSCEPCPNETPMWDGYSCQPCPERTDWNGNCCWNPEGWCEN